MPRHMLSGILTGALSLAAVSAITLTDPPAAGERALLGWTAGGEAGGSNLRMAQPGTAVSAGRALLGDLSASEKENQGEAIQIRPRRADGPGALLGR